MARPREFNTEDALERALRVFWAKGFEAASLRDLTGAMGLSKSSFYDTFGSKHDLLLSAIDYYVATVTERAVADLESGGPAKVAIAATFKRFVDGTVREGGGRGCFVGNCAIEFSPHDAEAIARVAGALSRIEQGFERAVERGQDAGEIPVERDARTLARYLTSSLQGLLLVARTNPDRAALDGIVSVVLSALE